MGTSSCITQIVQYSCSASSLKAATQKIGGGEGRGGEKTEEKRKKKEGVETKAGGDRERHMEETRDP